MGWANLNFPAVCVCVCGISIFTCSCFLLLLRARESTWPRISTVCKLVAGTAGFYACPREAIIRERGSNGRLRAQPPAATFLLYIIRTLERFVIQRASLHSD